MNRMAALAVISTPAFLSLSSMMRKNVMAAIQVKMWHLILLSVQCRNGLSAICASSLVNRKPSSTDEIVQACLDYLVGCPVVISRMRIFFSKEINGTTDPVTIIFKMLTKPI